MGVVGGVMKLKLAPLALVLALAAGACGDPDGGVAAVESDPTTTVAPSTTEAVDENTDEPQALPVVAPDSPVFEWVETGGCLMAGPNCARYVVTSDGTVMTYRGDNTHVEVTGTVDKAALDAWMLVAGETDVDALVDRAGPGELTAAFDGVDFQLDAPHQGTSLSSIDIEFNESEAYFAAAMDLALAARDAAPLEIEMR